MDPGHARGNARENVVIYAAETDQGGAVCPHENNAPPLCDAQLRIVKMIINLSRSASNSGAEALTTQSRQQGTFISLQIFYTD